MPETWAQFPGYEGPYEVSSEGRFRRVIGGKGAIAGRMITNRRLSTKGYVVVEVSRGDIKARFLAHQVVATAFLGAAPPGHFVNHKDGNEQNNSVGNLEWATPAENNRHAFETGLMRPHFGTENGRARLTEAQVIEIRRLKGVAGQAKLASRYGVAKSTIQWVQNGRNWSHV